MDETNNVYSLPVAREWITRATRKESPAHAGPLSKSIDFVCPIGTPVRAAAGGIVADVHDGEVLGGPDKGMEKYGNFVEICHDNDEYSEYEHLRAGIKVKVGERVRRGQIIGHVGATGWLAHLGPHLHFMVGRYEGAEFRTVDPKFEEDIRVD